MNNEYNTAENEASEKDAELYRETLVENEGEDAVDTEEAPNDATDVASEEDDFGAFDVLKMFISAICFVVVVLSFLFRTMIVDGRSMNHTLADKDILITSNLFYTPSEGDIVIFEHEDYDSSLVKRVIAVEGQTVDIDELGQVYVDGKLVTEQYANIIGSYDSAHTAIELPYTVPKDHIFVLGDNRNESEDSRWFGSINEQQVLGRVLFRLVGGFGKVK